ncbi:Glycosyltransferase involved in cell wall bisynthesis [Cyclobacterium xiamenense]|jgi:glycosyltransferase involved in cell wall biosynthesis|uniref:Glycosyltransferase involved in cell wall bisynthesis n=1 Tax=Cyclobacterium xiamenense TaxID=1297121 RepID=A0A1H6W847_9BACT|nr:glycosyltransferase family A protein [Cyclobacterium xiamenense]SEJ11926.1 Glycosyltransferase involved in cell wall bisynthesis [Cyclobacterium xiamenense]
MRPGLVSVVIPCYNQGRYLEETVRSVLASTYRPLELLLVNDGSTDDSLERARSLEKKHPEVRVIDQPNGGVARARNTGIRAAQGEFVLPLDGDDTVSDAYIAEAVSVLQQRPEVKVVYCRAVKFSEAGEKAWKLKPFSLRALARDNMIFVAALLRKSDADAVGGFSEDMHMGREDWEFWIKILKNGGEVVQLPFVGFYYRLTPGSKRKKTGTRQKKRERIAYLNKKHADFFQQELNGPLRFQRSWSRRYNTLLRWLGRK